jgi:sirohydrochlorin cobaltochelatase
MILNAKTQNAKGYSSQLFFSKVHKPMKTALVLAGHGSHISPETAAIVWQQVHHIRALRLFDEVTACFWKELPSFSRVLHTLEATDVTIVPMFTAQGYFTKTVIPTEMNLQSAISQRDGRVLRYAKTLGEHAYITQIVGKRVAQALQTLALAPQQVSVALIGHGTRRNPDSRNATFAQAQHLRETFVGADVHAVFLDDTPNIPDIYTLAHRETIIAVPYFLALGSHTTLDVPEELGLAQGERTGQIHGKNVYYTDPIGLDEHLTRMVLDLAQEAGATLIAHDQQSDGLPQVGKETFLKILAESGLPAPFATLVTDTNKPAQAIFADIETRYPSAIAEWSLWQSGNLAITPLPILIARQTGMYKQLADASHSEQVIQTVCQTCVRHPLWHDGVLPENKLPCGEACNVWLSKALTMITEGNYE